MRSKNHETMNIDWKDALGTLRDSGSIPMADSADEPTAAQEEKSVSPCVLHVVTDRKGRKGKTATIVEGFTGPDDDLAELARTLKQRLGVGGSFRGGEILIQGDRKEEVCSLLRSLGYKVK